MYHMQAEHHIYPLKGGNVKYSLLALLPFSDALLHRHFKLQVGKIKTYSCKGKQLPLSWFAKAYGSFWPCGFS